jgi:opacity protein-like surface antigen
MKRTLIFTAILIVILATMAVAQEKKAITIGLKTGVLMPTNEELKDTVKYGWLLGADVKFYFNDMVGIGVDARYASQGWKGDDTHHMLRNIASMADTQIEWSTMPISLNVYLRYDVGDGMEVFGGFGPTLMRTKLNMDFNVLNTGTPGNWSNVNGSNTSWWSQTNWVNYDPIDVAIDETEWGYGYNVVGGFTYNNFFVEGQFIMSETSYRDASFFFGGGDGKVPTSNFTVAIGYCF